MTREEKAAMLSNKDEEQTIAKDWSLCELGGGYTNECAQSITQLRRRPKIVREVCRSIQAGGPIRRKGQSK